MKKSVKKELESKPVKEESEDDVVEESDPFVTNSSKKAAQTMKQAKKVAMPKTATPKTAPVKSAAVKKERTPAAKKETTSSAAAGDEVKKEKKVYSKPGQRVDTPTEVYRG